MFHYFKIPYFTCIFFTKFTYNEYIGPYFLSHVVLRFLPVNSPRYHMTRAQLMFYKATTKVYWWFKLTWTSERLGFDQQNLLKVFFLYITKLTIKYIWRNHLFKNNKGRALVGTKTSNDNNKSNNRNFWMFVFHASQPPHLCGFGIIVYVILIVEIIQNSCINP
jgi:hypothetical protein